MSSPRVDRPARGHVEPGFEPVARVFAAHLARGDEVGAAFCAYHRGRLVVDLHGGVADIATRRPWTEDTRVLVFSVTKGLAAMAFALLVDRGQLDPDAEVATYWPTFARNGKEGITVRRLLNHQAGLLALDTPLRLEDCVGDGARERLCAAMEAQRPRDVPTGQGYHAVTFGMYAAELFERVAGVGIGPFLLREVFEPTGSDARLGTEAAFDPFMASLITPSTAVRVANMVRKLVQGDSTEARVARATLAPGSGMREVLLNPSVGALGAAAYDQLPIRRASLAWAGATSTARGLARAYMPFAGDGTVEGRRLVSAQTLAQLHRRQGWSERDAVLQKPLGWSLGFLKEETTTFAPHPESFGHAGMGGSLGWADPVSGLSFGYVTNRLDWRVRSPRALRLCRALASCEPVRG